jgi:hypothetical protein
MRLAARCPVFGLLMLGCLAAVASAPWARAEAGANQQPVALAPAEAAKPAENPGADAAPPDTDAAKPADGSSKAAAAHETPASKPRRLSPAAAALRDRVRHTLDHYFHQQVNTGENTPAEILAFALAFGCDAEVRYANAAGNPVNAIGCLCYGYPCAGYEMLVVDHDQRVMARVGYGLQEQPAQMLAVLAQSGVPANYEVRSGKFRGSVADLVESEKTTCRPGGPLAHKLIGLAFYVRNGETWKDAAGRTWSVERLVQEELDRPPANDTADVTDHLMALSFAVERRNRAAKPIEGVFAQAQKYVADFHQHAFRLQNSDGSWHPQFFAFQGTGRDASEKLRATGRILEWLAFSLPDDRLNDPKLLKSVVCVTGLLAESYANWNATATTPLEIASVGHALHALRVYDQRVFRPSDPADAPPSTKPAAPPSDGRAASAQHSRISLVE